MDIGTSDTAKEKKAYSRPNTPHRCGAYLPGAVRGRKRAALAAVSVVGLLPARKACQQPREGVHTP